MSTCSSSHIHWPEVVKLKKCPSMAKLLTKETRRPVGWPASVQLPVSSRTVFNTPPSTTSPPTPLISTQPSHEHEPSKKCHDEVLHRDRQPGAGKTENGCRFFRHTQNNEQNH